MTEPPGPEGAPPGLLRSAKGLRLLGEFQGSGFTEPRFLVRRGDGQVIQLSRLLYLVTSAIAESGTDGGRDASQVAARASAELGREMTAANVSYLVTGKLAPLGVVVADEPDGGEGARAPSPVPAPRTNLLLGLRIRGVLLRPRASGAIGRGLMRLHKPAVAAVVLAGFAAFESWLFAVHGIVGPLVEVLRQPVLFLAVAGLTLASLLFHEFGHASACRYGGARPGVIGFGLYLIWPSLYTDVTDAYRLDRAGRLRTDLGGVYFNAVFILVLGGCYAATGYPVFLAAAFLDNFQILQQLVPLVRMDGYFILGDLAGLPDLFGLLVPIMAGLVPGAAARRARARASGLRRGPRIVVSVWVLVTVPLLAAVGGYTLWHLPVLAVTAEQSFTGGVAAARAAFSAGDPATGLAAAVTVALLVIPAAGLAYLLALIIIRGATAALGQARTLGQARALSHPRALSHAQIIGWTRTIRSQTRRAAGWRQSSRRLLPVITASALGVVVAAGGVTAIVATSGPSGRTPGNTSGTATAARAAAAWIAAQVSPDVTVSCDPQMCAQIRASGFPAARLTVLRAGARGPFPAGVVVATPMLRDQFGARLASAYAPLVLAGFGSGTGQVDVRAVAPDGAAAFQAMLAAEHASLTSAGRQLLQNKNIEASTAARAVLGAGRADARLLVTLTVLAAQMPVRLVSFSAPPPGASAAVPLRAADISAASPADRSAIIAFLRAQHAPYRPAAAAVTTSTSGQPLIAVRFDAPGLTAVGGT
jgi:putative peptide zinc metalloprotease protein